MPLTGRAQRIVDSLLALPWLFRAFVVLFAVTSIFTLVAAQLYSLSPILLVVVFCAILFPSLFALRRLFPESLDLAVDNWLQRIPNPVVRNDLAWYLRHQLSAFSDIKFENGFALPSYTHYPVHVLNNLHNEPGTVHLKAAVFVEETEHLGRWFTPQARDFITEQARVVQKGGTVTRIFVTAQDRLPALVGEVILGQLNHGFRLLWKKNESAWGEHMTGTLDGVVGFVLFTRQTDGHSTTSAYCYAPGRRNNPHLVFWPEYSSHQNAIGILTEVFDEYVKSKCIELEARSKEWRSATVASLDGLTNSQVLYLNALNRLSESSCARALDVSDVRVGLATLESDPTYSQWYESSRQSPAWVNGCFKRLYVLKNAESIARFKDHVKRAYQLVSDPMPDGVDLYYCFDDEIRGILPKIPQKVYESWTKALSLPATATDRAASILRDCFVSDKMILYDGSDSAERVGPASTGKKRVLETPTDAQLSAFSEAYQSVLNILATHNSLRHVKTDLPA